MGLMLEGVRILDLSTNLPGPYCTMLLSDLGAGVIKVEEPRLGDNARVLGGYFFDQLNRGKRSVKINLKNPAGREAFLKLAARSDVVLESFRPGVVKRLGIDYEEVKKVNDRVIYCSISGFGQDGPMRDVPAHDLNIISMTGIQQMSGLKEGPPAVPPVLIADTASGSHAALAIVSALWQREARKIGQYLDISMYESCFAWQHFNASNHLSGFIYGAGEGILNGGAPCYNIYETADGRHISIGAVEPHFWAGICRIIGKEHLIDKQFALGQEADRAIGELRELFLGGTSGRWMEMLGPHGLCVAPVLSLKESLDQPQARHRNVLISGEHGGKVLYQINCPIKGPGIDGPLAVKGPGLGEHNEEVFGELGIGGEEYENFDSKGAFRM